MAAGKPKPIFFIAVAIVIAGLIVFALMNKETLAPEGGEGSENTEPIDPDELTLEMDDSNVVTTVQEWEFVPSEALPPVRGTSAYNPMQDNTVRFAINVWAGWAPIIHANEGLSAGKIWTTPSGEEFKVELVLIDDPVAMRDAYAAGEIHIGWATLDMVPLFLQGFVDDEGNPRDSRVMPRIYQQIDWSNGGDGIVVRDNIQSVSDLRGRQIVLAQNSPSHYFALNMLVFGGVQPAEVNWVFTPDAFQAAAAYANNPDISAAVTWAPDIYTLSEAPGNRMLVNTLTANKLIADVWFSRADFARDHEAILEGIVRGIFDSMETLYEDESAQDHVAQLMGAGYDIPAEECKAMLADAHWTNWAENYQFFVNRNNPAGFQRVWNQAYMLYSRIGTITHEPVPFEQVMDYSIIQRLAAVPEYANHEDRYRVEFQPRSVSEITGAESPILTQTLTLNFFPNSWDLTKTITREVNGATVEEPYDPNVDAVLEEIAALAGEFGFARIVISGHTAASMRGQVPRDLVVALSQRRANAVKAALIQRYSIDVNQLSAQGLGWDSPADPNDPNNHAKNRRVEIAVYPAEAN